MGQACNGQFHLTDSEEAVAKRLPVQQLSSSTPRPKSKAKPKPAVFSVDMIVQGKLVPDSWVAASPRKLCFGEVPVDRHEIAPGVPRSIFVPMRDEGPLSSPPPRKPPFSMIRVGKPDFTGHWLCSDVSGDMDALMMALQVPWARRTAARCIQYGKGIAIRNIMQKGNDLVVDCLGTPPTEFQQRFAVGRGAQQTLGPNGKVLVTPVWEHGYVLSVRQTELDGSSPSTWKQYFDGEDILFQMLAPTGETGFWRFSRQ